MDDSPSLLIPGRVEHPDAVMVRVAKQPPTKQRIPRACKQEDMSGTMDGFIVIREAFIAGTCTGVYVCTVFRHTHSADSTAHQAATHVAAHPPFVHLRRQAACMYDYRTYNCMKQGLPRQLSSASNCWRYCVRVRSLVAMTVGSVAGLWISVPGRGGRNCASNGWMDGWMDGWMGSHGWTVSQRGAMR